MRWINVREEMSTDFAEWKRKVKRQEERERTEDD